MKKRVLKSLPRSKAKTAWGLLQDVKRAIQEEPKRANMQVITQEHLPEEGGPSCGTVGCFAGWVSILAGKRNVMSTRTAEKILGRKLDYYTVGTLSKYVFNAGSGDECARTKLGTPSHARAVVNRIKRFMRINKSALKKKRV